jgi:hypothetical protein
MRRKQQIIDEIGREIEDYLSQAPSVIKIKSNELTVTKVPVDSGLKHFLDVDKLPDPDKLPVLPVRLREFATRYVSEYRPQREWAKIFNVSRSTINKWLSDPRVQQHIVYIQYECRTYSMAGLLQMVRNAMRAFNNILTTPISGDTIDTIFKTAKFAMQLMVDPSSISNRDKGLVNLKIGFPEQGSKYGMPIKSEFNATEADLKKLEEEIEHGKMVEQDVQAEDVQYEVEE